MLTLLGTALFIMLIGSAILGLIMLLAGCALCLRDAWRRPGMVIVGSGFLGSVAVLLALTLLKIASYGHALASSEAILLFGAAGFGWSSLLTAIVMLALVFLNQPARWVDRRRVSGHPSNHATS